MTKFIVSIISILLMLFPFSAGLRGKHQLLTYPGETVITDSVIEDVKAKNFTDIAEMFSPYCKGSIPNLQESIKTLLSYMDGEITDARWFCGASDTVEKNYGSYKSSVCWEIQFVTTKSTYGLFVGWVRADTVNPEKVGMDMLMLCKVADQETHQLDRLIVIE